ncbi:Do family serine endopeptidase [Roseibium salinum]|uniref:Do family serine endopeptidase n=1 Tax=Roseibium salinum TaxID=1604349 RepID=UPI0035ED01BB
MTPRITQYVIAPLALALAAAPVASPAQAVPQDFTEIVENMSPAVVAITAERPVETQRSLQEMIPPELRDLLPERFGSPGEPDSRAPHRGSALGSGFFISDEGHVVTNNHVVEGAEEIEVLMSDRTSYTAELVGADPATDLAVLKIDPPEDLTIARWGDSAALRPGAWTIAIGSPFGLGGTVTVGVLSARSRDIRSGPYDNFLQTDASINRGNSGGPLFNASGKVVGVNTAIISPSGANIGIGFAVPSSTARDVVSQLVQTGKVERGFIGVNLQPITDSMARALQLDSTDGALVSEVRPNTPASEAGLEPGDVIVGFAGEKVEDPRQLSRAVAARSPGEDVSLSVHRDGKDISMELTLATRQMPQETAEVQRDGADDDQRPMGLAVTELPEPVRRELGLRDDRGVLVQDVQPGSAAEAGIREGDVILEAGGNPVEAEEDLSRAWDQAREEKRPLLLRVTRNDSSLFMAVEPGQG